MKKVLNLITIIAAMILFFRTEFVLCQNANVKGVELYFREDWKEIPAATPVTQAHVNNPDLILGRYGPGADSIKKSHHPEIVNDPYYIWSGTCIGNWVLTLNKNNSLVDLSSGAVIQWRTEQSVRVLRIVLGLENNNWLVSEQGSGTTASWTTFTISVDTLKWRNLNINTVVAGALVPSVDLKRVKYVGFTDLMIGGGSPACSRLDWIEVYGSIVLINNVESVQGPTDYTLNQNYPNPFNPSTIISYHLPAVSQVQIKVFDLLGRDVVTLVNKIQQSGIHETIFNAQNLSLTSGIYFYTINAGKFLQTKKMMLTK